MNEYLQKPLPQPIEPPSMLCQTPFFEIKTEKFLDRLQKPRLHYTLCLGPAVMILPQLADGNFLFLAEQRLSTQRILWGIPGGRVDEAEDLAVAAARELLEETGYAGQLISLGSTFPFPGMCNQEVHFFLAKNCTYAQPPSLEPGEELLPCIKSLEEMIGLISQGGNIDGLLVQALFFYMNIYPVAKS